MGISFAEEMEKEIDQGKLSASSDGRITLSDFSGQPEAVTYLRTCCAAARKRNVPLDHVLITGEPGLGKTMLAAAIANEMSANMRITSGTAFSSAEELVAVLVNLNENDILFVDDIHSLKPDFCDVLFSVLQECVIDIILGHGSNANPLRLDLPYFTLIGASYKDDCVSNALKSRFGIRIELKRYCPEALGEIVKKEASSWQMQIDRESALLIGKAANGVPREAITILKRVRDFAVVGNENSIDEQLTKKVLELLDKTTAEK